MISSVFIFILYMPMPVTNQATLTSKTKLHWSYFLVEISAAPLHFCHWQPKRKLLKNRFLCFGIQPLEHAILPAALLLLVTKNPGPFSSYCISQIWSKLLSSIFRVKRPKGPLAIKLGPGWSIDFSRCIN